MKITLVQMSMTDSIEDNLKKSLCACDEAKDSDLIFFPEIQLSPFFPQYEKCDASPYLITADSPYIKQLCSKAKEHNLYISPNIYLDSGGDPYDSSLWITPDGSIGGISSMVHIAQAKRFYEQDYYTPSPDGFKVYDTPFGKVGIVICFDRHLPESIRTCTLMGAELIIIPTANITDEPLEMFEWEIRVQAMQNSVFIAMCNRVGQEGDIVFAGESLICDPQGNILSKADGRERLITCCIEPCEALRTRNRKPYFSARRPQFYL
ncbi:MAG: carbon-nitrogen hydrolase family protein [Ruminiclostridium sp.]